MSKRNNIGKRLLREISIIESSKLSKISILRCILKSKSSYLLSKIRFTLRETLHETLQETLHETLQETLQETLRETLHETSTSKMSSSLSKLRS